MGEDRSDWASVRGWILPVVVLVVAIGLIGAALLNGPAADLAPSTRPSLDRITQAPANDHEVITDQGTIAFGVESGSFVVALKASSGNLELARLDLLSTPAQSGSTPPRSGAQAFVMVCGPDNNPTEHRYVFGTLEAGLGATYAGPEAAGQVASDGTFLFALEPGAPDADIQFLEGTRPRLGFRSGAFQALIGKGRKQPSGCLVSA